MPHPQYDPRDWLSALLLYLSSYFFVDMSAMADGHETDGACLAVDRVNNPKTANAKFPESVKLATQWLATFGIRGDSTNRGLDRSFQVGMEWADDLGHMRRDGGLKRFHAVRRFFTGVIGSPKISSKERPFLPIR